MSPPVGSAGRRARRRHAPIPCWAQAVALVSLCAILFMVGLGDRGLAYSEGHRVGPAWEMLRAGMPWEAGDAWLVPHLFGQAYFRKPPGMAWAIATSTLLLGHNEVASRVPSALAMTALSLVSWRVSTRWLGSPWGLAAGVAQALFPFFWSSARSAEIEALNAGATGIAALLLADVLLRGRQRRENGAGMGAGALERVWASAVGAGVALCVMVLAKGPAGLPVVLSVPVAACLVRRSPAPLAQAALVWTLLIPCVVLGAIGIATAAALGRLDSPVITQSAGEFLWDTRKIGRILTLPAAAWGSMLPASLALLVVRWRGGATDAAARAPRTLALAWAISIAAYTLLGIANPRYTLPAATLLPPVAAFAMSLAMARGRTPRAGLARALMVFHPAAWPAILGAGFVAFLALYEGPRGRTSGDRAGAALGAVLDPVASRGATVWVDDLVECRPEVLLYARTWSPLLRIRWVKPLDGATARPGDVVIARTDRHDVPEGVATERDRCAGLLAGAGALHEFPVHKYTFGVYEIPGSTPREDGAPPR